MLARKVSLKDKAEVNDKPLDSNLQGEDRQKSKASAPKDAAARAYKDVFTASL
uniref:Uncharacterized protein n=1 Tax=Yersinia enterocolitica W22703 TaxID=913028 RepID=F4MWQ0_YEREN|nr:unknown protein [Yersinia enterocolitica W22703]